MLIHLKSQESHIKFEILNRVSKASLGRKCLGLDGVVLLLLASTTHRSDWTSYPTVCLKILVCFHPTPVHIQTDPSPAPPCGQSRMMQACGCRGPAGSWSTWPAGRSGKAWGGRRRPRQYAARCPPPPGSAGGRCCCHHQDRLRAKSWLGTAATRSQSWAHRSSSTGPWGRAYTLTG